jgi:hypothetical protein
MRIGASGNGPSCSGTDHCASEPTQSACEAWMESDGGGCGGGGGGEDSAACGGGVFK